MAHFAVTITRTETFIIETSCSDVAVDLAFGHTWMRETADDSPCILEHSSATVHHTVEEA